MGRFDLQLHRRDRGDVQVGMLGKILPQPGVAALGGHMGDESLSLLTQS